MGWITCIRSQKFRCDFVAQNFALIALVQPISHRVSCINETIQNAPKHYENATKHDLGSNGVDHVRSLPKIPMQSRGTNFALLALVQPISHRVSCSNETIQDAPKHYKMHQFCTEFRVVTKHCQMHRNTTKCSRTWVWFQWGGSSAFFAKNSDATLWHKLVH